MATQPAYVCTACRAPITNSSAMVCPNCGVDFTKVGPTPVGAEAYAPAPPNVAQSAAPASRRGWILLGAVIFVAIIAAAGFIGLTNSGLLTPHHTVTGNLELKSADGSGVGNTGSVCEGTDGYSDISPGAGVTISDGTGKILATSGLGAGDGGPGDCNFQFSLPDVPEVPFYSVTIGHRGALTYSLSEMESMGWTLSLTLGS